MKRKATDIITSSRQSKSNRIEWNDMLSLCAKLDNDGKQTMSLMILAGSHFGLRINRLLALRWCDILGKSELKLIEKKTGKQRIVGISELVQSRMSVAFHSGKHDIEDYIFIGSKSGKQLSTQYINKELKRIKERYKLNVKSISTHSLRKTFGWRVYCIQGQSEAALVLLSDIFGHTSIAITRKYLGITQQQIANVYLSL